MGEGGEVLVGGEWGEMGGVRNSCRVALAKLTPHSPDQSRQVGRRDGPAPRREDETQLLNKHRRTDGHTDDGGRKWGMEGWGREATYSSCPSVRGLIYDLPWRRREEQPAASRRERRKQRGGSLVKWHFGNNTTKSLVMLLFPSVSVFTCTQHS